MIGNLRYAMELGTLGGRIIYVLTPEGVRHQKPQPRDVLPPMREDALSRGSLELRRSPSPRPMGEDSDDSVQLFDVDLEEEEERRQEYQAFMQQREEGSEDAQYIVVLGDRLLGARQNQVTLYSGPRLRGSPTNMAFLSKKKTFELALLTSLPAKLNKVFSTKEIDIFDKWQTDAAAVSVYQARRTARGRTTKASPVRFAVEQIVVIREPENMNLLPLKEDVIVDEPDSNLKFLTNVDDKGNSIMYFTSQSKAHPAYSVAYAYVSNAPKKAAPTRKLVGVYIYS